MAHAETRIRIVVSADGSLLAAMLYYSDVDLYTADTLKQMAKIKVAAREIGLNHDGATLAVSAADGLKFHETSTGKLVASNRTDASEVNTCGCL